MSTSRAKKLKTLRDRALMITGFLASKDPGSSTTFAAVEQVIHHAFEKQNVAALASAHKDLLEWSSALRDHERAELDRLLSTHMETPPDGDDVDASRIKMILLRGRIANEDEYRLLHDRADSIHADPAHREELARINKLLNLFQRTRTS